MAQIQNGPSASRPLAMLTLALNFYFHQYRPTGYHIVNILIHIIAALLVFAITRQTLWICENNRTSPVPFLAAFLWLVHPLHTQSVTYIIQRMNSLATMFILLSLLCYIKARTTTADSTAGRIRTSFLFTTVILAGILGLASKPTAAILPIIIFFYEWFFLQDLSGKWIRKNPTWPVLAIVIFSAFAFAYLGTSPLEAIRKTYEAQTFSMGQRLLTEPLVVIYYLSLLFFPYPGRLNLDYGFPLSQRFLSPPATFLGPVVLGLLIMAAALSAKRHRLIAFAIVWYLTTLIIESSVIGRAIIFEHRTYLPSIFPIITMTWWLQHHLRRRALMLILFSLLIGIFCIGTFQRNQIWQTDIRLWKDCTHKSPQKWRPYSGLGMAYSASGNYHRAISAFQKALSLQKKILPPEHPAVAEIYCNLGVACNQTGQYRLAEAFLQKSLSIYRKTYGANHHILANLYNNISFLCFQQNDYNNAIKHLQRALHVQRLHTGKNYINTAAIYNNLGGAYYKKKNYTAAIFYYRQALQIKKTLWGVNNRSIGHTCGNLGIAYYKIKNYERAQTCLQEALRIYRIPPHQPSPTLKTIEKYLANIRRQQQKTPASRLLEDRK